MERKLEHRLRSILDDLSNKHLLRSLTTRDEGPAGGFCLDFSSNDYLNLSTHAQLTARLAVERAGAAASRLISGTLPEHLKLEEDLAAFVGYPAALLFGSGYLANTGALSALLGRSDIVLADRYIHASLIDGLRLSGARLYRFRHNDLEHLRELLQKAAGERKPGGIILIVTESVFSMDGDLAPLRELVLAAGEYEASLFVDDAHAFGVFGASGAGLVQELGLQSQVDFCSATLSKSCGCYGGAVFCEALGRSFLINKARSFIYSTALPPAAIHPAFAALRLMTANPEWGTELQRRAELFRNALQTAGLETLGSASQIVPLVTGSSEKALALAAALKERGIHAWAIRPPTVPEGTARLRFSVTLAHKPAELLRAAEIIKEEAVKAGVL